jgi:low affinity Fe/Cu permease
LQNTSSNTTKPNVTPNCPNFGEKVYISANGTPIKTFVNRPFFFIDPTIFPKAKFQFNVPTVQVNYPIHFKPNVSHNVSPYKFRFNIPSENIPTYIYCDTVTDLNKNEATYIVNLESNFFTTSPLSTSLADLLSSFLEDIKKNKDKCFVDGRNFIQSLIALTTFSQIKNRTIARITTKAIPQFFRDFILTTTDTLAHFTANWAFYVLHANKIATIISSRLIQQNTYEKYISAHKENLEAIIENSDECIVFFTHVCKHLQNVDLSIPNTNIKQMSDALGKVIINTIKYNLA